MRSLQWYIAAPVLLFALVAAALAVSDRLFLREGAVIVAALLAVVGTAVVTHYLVIRPIRHLAAGIRGMAGGDYGTRLNDALPAEFGELARGFNAMASSIEQHGELLLRQATTDQVTGLLNRGGVEARMAADIAMSVPFVCVYLTVPTFHEITSTLGYPASEVVLREVGDRLEREFPDAPIAHVGGNAFVLSVRGADGGVDRAHRTAERAQEVLEPEFQVGRVPLHVEFMVGAACYPEHGGDPETLVRKAEADARASGSRHTVLDAAQDEPDTSHLEMVTALRDALLRGGLELHYQPLVDLEGNVQGAEALLRWDRDGEWVPPGVFIPVAERSGMMMEIDRWVFGEAVAQARRWQDAGRPVPIAINVSARSLEDLDFPVHASEVLAAAGVAPELITIEITETAMVTLFGNALAVTRQLGDLGIRMALDDFGIGHSPIHYLRAFPVSRVKVDLTLVRDLARVPEVRSIVQTLIGMAKAMHLETVGEGVETSEAERILQELGCDLVQGYLHGRPMDVPAFGRWMRAHPNAA